MFDIDTDMLIEIASSSQALLRGANYLKEGRIIDIFAECDNVYALVQGNDTYKVNLYFNEGHLKHYQCSCKAFENYEGACKHIIAVLLYLHSFTTQPIEVAKENYFAEDEILDKLSQTYKPKRTLVKVEYEIEFLPYKGVVAQMCMKLGVDRMYIVRNIKGFLQSLYEKRSFKFGKRFIFNPMIHQFSPQDQQVFEKLLEMYEIEKSLSDTYYEGKYLFIERFVNLPYPYLRKVATTLRDTYILAKSSGSYVPTKAVFEVGKLPCNVLLRKTDNGIVAKIDAGENLEELNPHYGIFSQKNKIYLCDKEDSGYAFLKGIVDKNGSELKFEGERSEKLLSLIPNIEKSDYIDIDSDIEDLYVREPMKLQLIIDKHKKGLSIDVKFIYSEYEVRPQEEIEGDKFILREYEKEQFVLKLLEDSGFYHKDKFIMEDEDKIYTFAKDVAPTLTQLGDVYYTNEVKSLFDIKTPSYKTALKSIRGNLLEIDVEIDNLDEVMVEKVLKAVREKKRYFRLKDGSFISLEDEKTKDFGKVLENIDRDELDRDTLTISKYKMMGIMQKFDNKESFPIEDIGELKDLVDNVVNFPKNRLTPPISLAKILRNYQVTGFKWLKVLGDNGLGGILADDMGLGKTLQAISFILSNKGTKENLPSLVVAPSTLVYNWEREIKKFAPSLLVQSVEGDKKLREEKIKDIPKYDVIITSYPLLRNDIDFYKEFDFYSCILDEAQHIKNPNSITANSVKKIKAYTRFALTGTPIENSPGELWSIFDFVMPGYLGSYKKFEEDFQKPIMNGSIKVLERLKQLISPFILRRSKEQVLKELPEKIVTTIPVDLTASQQRLYKAYLFKIKEELEDRIETEGFEKSRMHIFTGLLRLRQICCHPKVFVENYNGSSGKIEALKEILGDMVAAGHRILIFSQFTSMLEIIKNLLKKMNIPYSYLDGGTKVTERKKIVDEFNEGKSDVFLLSLKAGGVGLNLTSADTVIHFDPWWNPAVEKQASDRVHRIGQKRKVHVIRLIAKGTVEERIDELQKMKRELADSVIEDGEILLNTLSRDEILELFSVS